MMELPKKIKPLLGILFNFVVQLISNEIILVDNQELCFFHTDHSGPPYWRTQKAHFLLGRQGQRQVRGYLSFPASVSPLPLKFLLSRLQVLGPPLCSCSSPLQWAHSSLLICCLWKKRQQTWPGQSQEAGEASLRSHVSLRGHMGNILLKHHKWRVGLWQIRVLGPTIGQWLAQNIRQDWAWPRGSNRNLSHSNPSPGSQALPPLPQNSRPSAATSGGGLGRRCCHPHPRSLRLFPSRWNKSCCSSSPSLWSHVCDQTWEKTIALWSSSNPEPGTCWEESWIGCALCSGELKHRLGLERTQKSPVPVPSS